MNSSTAVGDTDTAVAVRKSRPARLKRLLSWVMPAAALVLAVVFGIHWWTVGRFIESTDDAYIGGDVTVIGPKVSGYITELNVTDNQRVHAGDLLVKIDDRDYVAALHKAEGAVAAEEALLANLDATEQLQYAVIGQAKASIDAANAETVRSRDDHSRYQRLVSQSAVSVESAQRVDATFRPGNKASNGHSAAAGLVGVRVGVGVRVKAGV